MEPGVSKKEIMADTSIDRSYYSVTESEEEREIRILKWQFELMLNSIDEISG